MNDTYKYHFKIGNVVVHGGITYDLARRETEHKNSGRWTLHRGRRLYWIHGHIKQVGYRTTREAALRWERENGFGANQN
jgi:predicted GIY-YIG superfamily endonuclease